MRQSRQAALKICFVVLAMAAWGGTAEAAGWSRIDSRFIVDPVVSIKASSLPKSC